jgi:ketopantoate reductase
MPMGLPHRIAIVGAGLIGSALAGHLILAESSGHGDSQRRGRVVRRGLP